MSSKAAATSIGKSAQELVPASKKSPEKLKTSPTTVTPDSKKLNNNEPITQTQKYEKPCKMEVDKLESKVTKAEEKKVEQADERTISKSMKVTDSKCARAELKHCAVEKAKATPSKIEKIEPKVTVENATTQTDTGVKYKVTPIVKHTDAAPPSKVAVPRRNPPLSTPLLHERPLVVATHLVPSLPISLFEVFVEAIEVATEKPAVLLYEPRCDRPVAKDTADIAILPANGQWEEGVLLPVSFCFEHRLNKDNSSSVYADVIVTADRARHVEDITDLRGHRCSLPDRRKGVGAAALLFDHLYTRGESPSFFGNTLDANTQVATLQMVAGKQAEVGILESPVIKCHKNSLPGVESVCILTSLGPLPPYRIMVNKALPDSLVQKIAAYLLNIKQDKEWMERFAPYGVTGFADNAPELYDLSDAKPVVTSVPYY